MNLQESIQRIKKIIEQTDPSIAASGPQKCGITQACEKEDKQASKELKVWDKELARQNKIDAREKALENKNFLSLSYDRNSDPLDRDSRKVYQQQYQEFLNKNPNLLDNSDGFNTEQKYAIISKVLDFIKRVPSISYSTRLKNKFGVGPTSKLTDIVDVINKMGGWTSFMSWFNSGGPEIK